MKKFKKVLALILAFATMFSTVPIPNYAAGGDSFATLEYWSKENTSPPAHVNAILAETTDVAILNDNNLYYNLYRNSTIGTGGRIEIKGYSSIAVPNTLTFTYDVLMANPADTSKTLTFYYYEPTANTFASLYSSNPSNIIGTYPIVVGSTSITLDSTAVNKMFAAFNSGKIIAITSNATNASETAIYNINFTPNGTQASSDTAVTCPDGSFVVDPVAGTISSGTTKITTAITVDQLKSKLQAPAAASTKVTRRLVLDAPGFDDADLEFGGASLAIDTSYVVKAEDGTTFQVYRLVFAQDSDDLATKSVHYTVGVASITANATPINNNVNVSAFLNNLDKHATAGWLVAPGTSTFANETALRAEIASRTALSKAGADKLAAGDKLWTVSEAGVVRSYTVAVALGAPVTITELDLTTLVPVPVTGSNVVGTFETSQYTAEILWSQTDGTPIGQPKFGPSTNYSAQVTILPKAGYTVDDILANSAIHTGAESITNNANSHCVTINFPKTQDAVVVNLLDLTSLVTAPVRGANQNTTAIDTAQYTGTIAWYESDKITLAPTKFEAGKEYTAKVSLTEKLGFTVSGLAPFCFSYTGALQVANLPNSGEVEIDFAATEAEPVSNLNLTSYVPAPVVDNLTVTTNIDNAQYTGSIAWFESDGVTPFIGTYANNTVYKARITLTPKAGYTLTGVTANSFTNTNAATVTNAENSGTVWMTFAKTPAATDTTPPVFATNYPLVSNISHERVVVEYNINEAAMVDFMIKPSSEPAPTTLEFNAGKVTVVVLVGQHNTVQSKAFNSLTPSTAYTLYYRAADFRANMSSIDSVIFATAPAPDTTPPTFANGYPSISNITHNSVTVSANINEAGSFKFLIKRIDDMIPTNAEFDLHASPMPISAMQAGSTRSALHNGLTPSTDYKVYYKAIDSAGNATNMLSTVFSTTVVPDTTPPEFAGNSPSISGITQNSAALDVIMLDSGVAEYMVVPSNVPAPDTDTFDAGKLVLTISIPELGLPKIANLTGLNPDTVYNVFYRAKDQSGNATSIQSIQFKTDAGVDTTPPSFTMYPSFTDISTTAATMNAKINEVGRIEYMLKLSSEDAPDSIEFGLGKSTLDVTAPQVDAVQSVAFTGLAHATTYKLYFRSIDSVGNKSDIGFRVLTTFAPHDSTAPEFVVGYPKINSSTHNSASLDVKVNEESKFEYLVVLDSEDTTTQDYFDNHKTSVDIPADSVDKVVSVSLPALTVSTHYKIFYIVVDKNSNKTNLAYITFTSSPIPDIVAPTFAQGLPSVTGIEQTAATFNVNLNEAGTVHYIVRSASQNALTQSEVYELGTAITVAAPNTLVTKSLASLTPGTQYKIYYVANDASNNKSPVASLAFTTAAPPVTPPSGGGGSSGGSGGGGGGGSGASTPTSPTAPTSPISPAPTTTQSRPIDVIVNGVNKSAGTLITGQTSGGQQTATVSVSTSGVVEQLKTPATTGKPSVIVEIPKVSGTGLQATYSAEVTAQSATAMVGAGAGLSVRTPVSTVELSSGAMDTLSELMNRARAGQSASLLVSASPASTTYRPATLGAAPIRSILTTPIEYSTAVVTDSTRVAVSDYNAFVGRTLSVSPEMLTTAQGQGTPGGTQGVVYINGSAYPVPTFRADGKVTINSITNSVYDLIMYSKSFTDTKGHKYDKSITNMASRLIVTGESAERFNPDAKVTRGEFATMVTRALGLYRGEMGKTKFKDLTKINGINVGITVAADRGLVTGVGKNTFAPNDNITAKDMSQILFNIVKKYGDTGTFTNKASELKTTGYAKEAVAFTTKAGLLEVKSADKEMTRAEAAFAIEQMLEGMNLIDKR